MRDLAQLFVPVDFSRGSRAALAVARQLAEVERGTLHVAHVVPPMTRALRATLFPYAAMGDEEPDLLEELRGNALRAVQRYLRLDDFSTAPLGGDDDTAHRLEALAAAEGDAVADLINARVREVDPDLVVIGHSGEGPLTPGLAGSVATRLAAECPRPTLLVRAGERRTIRSVAAALDMSSASPAVYEAALLTALRLQATLTLLIIIPDPTAQDVCGVLANTLNTPADALKKRGRKDTVGLLARYRAGVQVPFPLQAHLPRLDLKELVLVGDPALSLIRYTAQHDVDLLVIGRRSGEHNGLGAALGRTAAALVGAAPALILSVPS